MFISRRLNRWGIRFGFVRFFDVANVSQLEKELDQIHLGKMKLNVNIPKGIEEQILVLKRRKENIKVMIPGRRSTRRYGRKRGIKGYNHMQKQEKDLHKRNGKALLLTPRKLLYPGWRKAS